MNALRFLRGMAGFYAWVAMQAIDALRRGRQQPAVDTSEWTDGTWD